MAEVISSAQSEKKGGHKMWNRLQAAMPLMGTADCLEKILKELEELEPYDGRIPNIIEVPSRLRDLKQPDPYTPGVVSIGPCHHNKHKHLKQIEKRKRQLLKHLLRIRRAKISYNDLVRNMSMLFHAKELYDKPLLEGLTDQQFLEMMLLDACFILELLHNSANEWDNCEDTSNPLYVFHQQGFIPFIRRDLLMLENQLPLYVLEEIFTIFWGPIPSVNSIVTLALKFFNKVIPGISENIPDNSKKYERSLHFLDIIHTSLKPSKVEQVSETPIWFRYCCPSHHLFPCPNPFPCRQVTDHATRISLNNEGNNVSDPAPANHATRRTIIHDQDQHGERVSDDPPLHLRIMQQGSSKNKMMKEIVSDPSPSNHAARTVLEGEILSDPPPANHATRNVHDEHGKRVFHPPPSNHARRTVQNEDGKMMSDPSPSNRATRTVQEDVKVPMHSVHSVTRLRGTGIKFEKKDSKKFIDIEFKEDKLLIPPLLIHGSTRSIFLNLMAFEQCYPDRGRHITAYISFMDGLINSSKDVEHLIEKGIIDHHLGSEDDVATLINNLRKEMVFDTNDNYLSNISEQLNEHYEHKWLTWKTTLKHEYLKDPWKIISLVAAGLLIFLTIAQTAYTMVSYHFPKN